MGWLDKYKDGGYLGTTNKPNKYNGAWGGQWQNGGEMSYYQQGRDFKPKMISQNGSNVSPENKFYDYLKLNEGVRYKPYKDRKSKEAKETIGAGHKITPKERKMGMIHGIPYKKGISPEQVDIILQKDLSDKRDSLNNYLQRAHNITLDDLTPLKQYALLDLEFNTGSAGKEFPKFTKAVVEGDYNVLPLEYKRTMKVRGKQVPLEQRNRTFNKEYVIPIMAEDIVKERLKSGSLKFVPNQESINQRAEDIVESRKDGGVVKDNLGYWNPDNVGKVVEIDSPNITMRGVDRNLIGVSDEGDAKLLRPGKDYKFKGKKVMEYPIAKYGINELHELTDFTNKPSTKRWLNKYV